MSMHNTPLTLIEREGLEKHGLPIGKPSQLSDTFRLGIAWALAQQGEHKPNCKECAKWSKEQADNREWIEGVAEGKRIVEKLAATEALKGKV